MSDRQKQLIEKWNERWDQEDMKKLIHATYNVNNYEYEEGDDLDDPGRIVLREGYKSLQRCARARNFPYSRRNMVLQLYN